MSTLTTKVTPADLLAMQDANSAELINGEVVEKEVSEKSSYVAMTIGTLLNAVARPTREARVYGSDLGYQCFPDDADRIRKPDVSVIRSERLNAIEVDPGFMPIPADLAVEVISRNDKVYEVTNKVEEYLAANFGLIWLVNPAARSVQVFRRDGSTVVLLADDELTGESALPSFRCKVSELFT